MRAQRDLFTMCTPEVEDFMFPFSTKGYILTTTEAIPNNLARVSSPTSLKSSRQIRFTALAASFTNGTMYGSSCMGKPPMVFPMIIYTNFVAMFRGK
ncbi:MAG: hypothetical protein AUK55_03915 [Syntrophobacteraceae bacterium CG2_30_61_12]|nr:MAG: hypothetical protein AUK55_03915 [Syntrophobacteraceae bacterium CG2_30_61_12]PIU31355.1 MAG: hypothetical protein COT06_08630 [Syntrophobacteraceae bacterium CG07_land_8_20_14_0_80_61_8]